MLSAGKFILYFKMLQALKCAITLLDQSQ